MTDRSVSMHNPNAKIQQHVSSRTGHFLQQQAYVAPPGPIPSLMSHELSARAAAVTSTFPSYREPSNAAPFSSGPEHDGHNVRDAYVPAELLFAQSKYILRFRPCSYT